MTLKSIALIVGFTLAAPGAAITPYLVKDINTMSFDSQSSPQQFVSLGSRAVFFTGQPSGLAEELWATDGTLAGTSRLSSTPFEFVLAASSGIAYVGEGSTVSYVLWITDGTPQGTQRLSEEVLNLSGTLPLTAFQSAGSKRFYWTAVQESEGEELWTSNGTRAGTYRVADIAPGPRSSRIRELTPFRGRMFFAADDGRGYSLWSTNGSPAGTVLVKVLAPSGSRTGAPFKLRVVGQTLFFFLEEPDGVFLWKSNGTAAGTVRVLKLPEIRSSLSIYDAISHLGRLFFVTSSFTDARQLWTSDGTASGTRSLTRSTTVVEFFSQQIPGMLVFSATDSAHGYEPWVSNGTPAGTRLLKDICPGTCRSTSSGTRFKVLRNRLVFPATTPGQGQELWTTDGTAAGTRILRDFCAGSCGGLDFLGPMTVAGDRIYFTAYDKSFSHQLWRSDATPAGTLRLSNFSSELQDRRFPGAAAGAALIFTGYDPVHGRELWRSDGSRPGTRLLANLEGPAPGSSVQSLTPVGTRVVFHAFDGVRAGGWVSDGTSEGTLPLPEGPNVEFATPALNLTYFYSRSDGTGALWRTDGTEDGTFRLTPPELSIRTDLRLVAVGDLGYFVADDGVHGAEIWISDGTIEGTRLFTDLVPGSDSSLPSDLRITLGRLTFTAYPRGNYVTDGTEAGTRPFSEVFPFLDGLSPLHVESGGRALFQKLAEGTPTELWSSDGTEGGTQLVLGHLDSLSNASAAGGHFLFQAGTMSEESDSIYLSDGSPAGTVRLASELNLVPSLIPLQSVAGRYVFSARPADNPDTLVLLTSDGTSAGTRQLLEGVNPALLPLYASPFAGRLLLSARLHMWISDGTPEGTSSIFFPTPLFDASPPVVAGDRAYFSRRTLETGMELWALRPD